MRKTFKEYLQETIITKRALKKQNQEMKEHIDKMMVTLQEARNNEKYAIQQMNKYKKKLRELKKEMKNNGN